ncbi:MAG: efflux RND transporter periplasmic adaptor subunit [Lentisphaeria bacterium]
MKKIRFVIFAVLVIAFIVWAMLYQAGLLARAGKIPAGEKVGKAVPSAVVWQTLSIKEMPTFFKAVCSIRSREEIDLVSRLLTARVTEVPWRNGEHFKEGDVLVKMEDRDLRAKVAAAEENLKGAESRLKYAEQDYERIAKLLEVQAVAVREYDASLSSLNAVRAQVAMLKHELQYVQTNLEYAVICAPFDGVVSERNCDPGDLATPLNTLLKIFNPDKLQFRIPVREGLYPLVKIGDKLHAKIEATGQEYFAEVKEIIPSVDPGSRSFIINACLEGETRGLMPGMFSVCQIPTGTRKVLAIAPEAVQRIGQLEYMLIKGPDSRPLRQLVKTTSLKNDLLEIISGAEPGDEYAVTVPAN